MLMGSQQKELVSVAVWANVDLIFTLPVCKCHAAKTKSVHKQAPGHFILQGHDAVSACLSISHLRHC